MTPLHTLTLDCRKLLGGLRTSPTFAMSRGGKELFHTNFIAFVLDMDPNSMEPSDGLVVAETQAKLIKLFFGRDDIPSVLTWREKSSLDLIVLAAPIQGSAAEPFEMLAGAGAFLRSRSGAAPAEIGLAAVVIEAKMKALPSHEQLTRYNAKIEKGVLLEFADPITVSYGEDTKNAFLWGQVELQTQTQTPSVAAAEGKASAIFRAFDVAAQKGAQGDSGTEDGQVKKGRKCFAKAEGLIRRVLLAPGDIAGAAAKNGWSLMEWNALLECFPPDGAANNEGLTPLLLRDYRRSTGDLLKILELTDCAIQSYIDSASVAKLNDAFSAVAGETSKDFRQLRIHDVVGKRAYSRIEAALRTDLLELEKTFSRANNFELVSYTFLSNATPGIGIELRKTGARSRSQRTFSIGVQLQGTEYRHYVSASHPGERKGPQLTECAEILGHMERASKGWWIIDIRSPPQLLTNPQFGMFNVEAFLYTRAEASHLSFGQLATCVKSSMARAMEVVSTNAAFVIAADVLLSEKSPVV